METIKEFLRVNGRALGVALVVVAVVAGISLTADNNDEQTPSDDQTSSESTQQNDTDDENVDKNSDEDNGSEDKNDDKKDEENSDEASDNSDSEADTSGEKIGSTPPAGEVEIDEEGSEYKAEVRSGDNQTVIVRQIVNDYLSSESKQLSAPQRLYMETVLVNEIGRDDTIAIGTTLSLSQESVEKAAQESEALTKNELERWSVYL